MSTPKFAACALIGAMLVATSVVATPAQALSIRSAAPAAASATTAVSSSSPMGTSVSPASASLLLAALATTLTPAQAVVRARSPGSRQRHHRLHQRDQHGDRCRGRADFEFQHPGRFGVDRQADDRRVLHGDRGWISEPERDSAKSAFLHDSVFGRRDGERLFHLGRRTDDRRSLRHALDHQRHRPRGPLGCGSHHRARHDDVSVPGDA